MNLAECSNFIKALDRGTPQQQLATIEKRMEGVNAELAKIQKGAPGFDLSDHHKTQLLERHQELVHRRNAIKKTIATIEADQAKQDRERQQNEINKVVAHGLEMSKKLNAIPETPADLWEALRKLGQHIQNGGDPIKACTLRTRIENAKSKRAAMLKNTDFTADKIPATGLAKVPEAMDKTFDVLKAYFFRN